MIYFTTPRTPSPLFVYEFHYDDGVSYSQLIAQWDWDTLEPHFLKYDKVKSAYCDLRYNCIAGLQ